MQPTTARFQRPTNMDRLALSKSSSRRYQVHFDMHVRHPGLASIFLETTCATQPELPNHMDGTNVWDIPELQLPAGIIARIRRCRGGTRRRRWRQRRATRAPCQSPAQPFFVRRWENERNGRLTFALHSSKRFARNKFNSKMTLCESEAAMTNFSYCIWVTVCIIALLRDELNSVRSSRR
jgi:hypothetical protein